MNPAIAKLLEDVAELRERARVVCEHTQNLIDDYHKICARRIRLRKTPLTFTRDSGACHIIPYNHSVPR
jgi:hypothetical protein